MFKNCGDPDRFTSCKKYPTTSYGQLYGLHTTTFRLAVPKDWEYDYPNPETHPHMGPHVWPDLHVSFRLRPCQSLARQARVRNIPDQRVY